MSYTINLTNGFTLTQIVDGTFDQTATNLTLIGKNTSAYGQFFNENFVYLLENFANSSQPNKPITGQLWFDTSENRLKVYNGIQFTVTGGTIVSNALPSTLSQGDLWIDSFREQIYFNDGINTVLAGPVYSAQQGLSGFKISDILDTSQNYHTVAELYVGGTLLGIFSSSQFTPASAITGFTGTVYSGFNSSTLGTQKVYFRTTSSDTVADGNGNLYTADNFIKTQGDASINGQLILTGGTTGTPIQLGSSAQNKILVSDSIFNLYSNKSNQNFQISVLQGVTSISALFVNTATQNSELTGRIGIYNTNPQATLDVNGTVNISGNLTVGGTTTFIEATNLQISDKNIEINKLVSGTNSDILADGGGITLHGTADKTLTWVNATGAWTSSEKFNLVAGKTYQINGQDVLTYNTLGSNITTSSLTSTGILTNLQVSNLYLNNNTISFINASIPNSDIVISPKGTGSLNVSSARITNVANPVGGNDAVNQTYLNTTLSSIPLGVGLVTTGLTNIQIGTTILAKMFPNSYYQNGTICRVQCSDSSIRQFQLVASVWTYQSTL
jgi:hypothetical protein